VAFCCINLAQIQEARAQKSQELCDRFGKESAEASAAADKAADEGKLNRACTLLRREHWKHYMYHSCIGERDSAMKIADNEVQGRKIRWKC